MARMVSDRSHLAPIPGLVNGPHVASVRRIDVQRVPPIVRKLMSCDSMSNGHDVSANTLTVPSLADFCFNPLSLRSSVFLIEHCRGKHALLAMGSTPICSSFLY